MICQLKVVQPSSKIYGVTFMTFQTLDVLVATVVSKMHFDFYVVFLHYILT